MCSHDKAVLHIRLFFGALSLSAQDHVEALALKYPFLDTAKNHIQYYGNADALEGFFTKLDKAIFEYEGKVNVVHMGGSHVQGGTLSHTMRMNLGQLAPELNVERGFFSRTAWPTPTCRATSTSTRLVNGRV